VIPDDLSLLVKVFGASWYFTRLIFYRGKDAALIIDDPEIIKFDIASIISSFEEVKNSDVVESQLDRLRLQKNEFMLRILLGYLSGVISQKEMEHALTCLADVALYVVMDIFGLHTLAGSKVAVLGMGRMAGYEMTFGSDLDLIFLFECDSQDTSYELSKKIRLLLRNISTVSSAGSLYDIDMRLRPHGSSGALLTSSSSFIEYNQTDREIWERQVMTRCRPVVDKYGLGRNSLQSLSSKIYADYSEDYLRSEIINMRKRVEKEKGEIQGKCEVKRGKGGLMDIDFITHFLQLKYGYNNSQMKTCSTRTALETAGNDGLIESDSAANLLQSYDFLKRVEASIRLFDMKSISDFPQSPEAHQPLARAMAYIDGEPDEFLNVYRQVTGSVRDEFAKIVGSLA